LKDAKAIELTVSGEVRRVGYRRLVEKAALRHGVVGYVKNQPDGTVKILAEGAGDQLDRFLQAIDVKEPPVFVAKIERRERKPTGRYKTFVIKTGTLAEELQEGLGAGQEQLGLLRHDFTGLRQEFGGFREEFRDYRQEFREYREEFRDYREEFRDYREEFRDFAKRTDENFRLMFEKFGEISEKTSLILDELATESRETRRQLAAALEMVAEALRLLHAKQQV